VANEGEADGPVAYLQNVTVFEKEDVSTDATAIKGSV